MKTTFTSMQVAMKFMVRAKLILACAGMSFALATNALAQKETRHPASHMHSMPKPSGAQPEPPAPAKLSIPDVEVLDQNGKKRRFYSDLVKDRVVVINFMFTTCTKICPMSGANFSRLQNVLGERLGRNVFLISVTTDPETDAPEKLKAWGQKFKAKAGWTLITGEKETVDGLLRVLTGDGLNKGYHVPSLVIVNDPRQLHRRAYGLEQPDRVVKMVDELTR